MKRAGGEATGDAAGPVIVSACLAGLPCRYDGSSCPHPAVLAVVRAGRALPVCPEQVGGLPTPRPPAEIAGGDGGDVLDGRARVVDANGEDVTEPFLRGAQATLALARAVGARRAILKARSPSCGVGAIRDGNFSGRVRPGDGVTAALLRRHGIEVHTDEELGSEVQ